MGMNPATSSSQQSWLFRPFCLTSSVNVSASTGGASLLVPWMAHHMAKRKNTVASLRCTAVESQRETSSSVSSIKVLDEEGSQVRWTILQANALSEIATRRSGYPEPSN